MLQRKQADICSIGVGVKPEGNTAVDFALPTHRDTITLIAPNTEGDSIDVWAYLEVFGIYEWLIFTASIVSFVIIATIFNNLSRQSSNTSCLSSVLNASMIACMFVIQMGDHGNAKSLGKRMLTLTTSMLTLLMFLYYTTDITAKMTSGPPSIPVKTFEDVIQHNYKVVHQSNYHASILADGPAGSAKKQAYETIVFVNEPALKITSEPKTLWFTELSALVANPSKSINERAALQEVSPLKMDDESNSIVSLALQKDSEFLDIFNYYIMKQYENGILDRLFRNYHMELLAREQFGMSEPKPLGYEKVVFPFTCLVMGVTASLWFAAVEMITSRLGWSWGNNPDAITRSTNESCPEKRSHFDHDRFEMIEVIRATVEDLQNAKRGEGVEEAIQRLRRLSTQLEGLASNRAVYHHPQVM